MLLRLLIVALNSAFLRFRYKVIIGIWIKLSHHSDLERLLNGYVSFSSSEKPVSRDSAVSAPIRGGSPWISRHPRELCNISSHHKCSCYSHSLHKGHEWQIDVHYSEDGMPPSPHRLSDGINARERWNSKNLFEKSRSALRLLMNSFATLLSRILKDRRASCTVLRSERKALVSALYAFPCDDERCWLERADVLKRR